MQRLAAGYGTAGQVKSYGGDVAGGNHGVVAGRREHDAQRVAAVDHVIVKLVGAKRRERRHGCGRELRTIELHVELQRRRRRGAVL